ncbi:MAG: tetratricopeptide repeat protein [Treponema sp.]|nr:tetratricopeptide repeat protein [Treponema sp.]
MALTKSARMSIWPLLLGLMLFPAVISTAQESAYAQYVRRYQNGIQFYDSSRWYDAAIEFRRAQEIATSLEDWSRAIYWVILSELGFSDYGSAIIDMDELERVAPNSSYARDMVYHRARIYYNLGYFDDAIVLFRRYIDSVSPYTDPQTADRVAAAYFWMGECLFSMGQYNEAENFYTWVLTRYPVSQKGEVSSYRLDLIKQKKIEAELLTLLQWSHEESLRTSEDYMRRIRMYEQTINLYERRINELSQGGVSASQFDVSGEPAAGESPAASVILPQETAQSLENTWQSLHERLLERARQLNRELDLLIDDYIRGGSF